MQKLKEEVLFSKFAAIWGQKWLKSFEDERVREVALTQWGMVFEMLIDEQITDAVNRCAATLPFPPSISEFLEAALYIPSLAAVKHNPDALEGNPFYEILSDRMKSKSRMMTAKEEEFYVKEMYELLRDEFLLGNCKEYNEWISTNERLP